MTSTLEQAAELITKDETSWALIFIFTDGFFNNDDTDLAANFIQGNRLPPQSLRDQNKLCRIKLIFMQDSESSACIEGFMKGVNDYIVTAVGEVAEGGEMVSLHKDVVPEDADPKFAISSLMSKYICKYL